MSAPTAKPAQEFGARPKLEWLPVAKLSVDRAYQRTLDSRRSQSLITKIAARFRWSAFQAILATPAAKGGGWLVLDGQHRVEAAKRCGLASVPAVVVDAASVEEQAQAFVQANLDRVNVTGFALFQARLAAKEKTALAVKRACDAAGILIPRSISRSDLLKPGETVALGTIAGIVLNTGRGLAPLILGAVSRAYGAVPGGMRAGYFNAVRRLVVAAAPERREATAQKLEAAMASLTPGELHRRADQRREARGGTEIEAIAGVLGEMIAAPAAPALVKAPAAPAPRATAKPADPCAATLATLLGQLHAERVRVEIRNREAGTFLLAGKWVIDRRRLLKEANDIRQAKGLRFFRFEEIDWERAA